MNANVDSTIEYIKSLYGDSVDRSGNPLWMHSVRVASRVVALDDEFKVVALLHDVLEDTDLTPVDLFQAGYSLKIVEAVKLLSRNYHPEKTTYAEMIDTIINSGNVLAVVVKYADNRDNSAPSRNNQLPESERGILKRYAKTAEKIEHLFEEYPQLKSVIGGDI